MKINTTMALIVGSLVIGFVAGHIFTGMLLPTPLALAPEAETVTAVPTMSDMMHDMSAALEGKTGAAFDAQFLSDMIVHHEGAVAMAKQALLNASDPRIKELSAAIIAAQEKEIASMKSWQTVTPVDHSAMGHE
jgi:Domain of unknown function (DUF305)